MFLAWEMSAQRIPMHASNVFSSRLLFGSCACSPFPLPITCTVKILLVLTKVMFVHKQHYKDERSRSKCIQTNHS